MKRGTRTAESPTAGPVTDVAPLLKNILDAINQSDSRIDFVEKVSRELLDALGSDLIEIRVREMNRYYDCRMRRGEADAFVCETLPYVTVEGNIRIPARFDGTLIERLCHLVFTGRGDLASPGFTATGSFWTNDASLAGLTLDESAVPPATDRLDETEYRSLFLTPLRVNERLLGLLLVASQAPNFFAAAQLGPYEALADVLAGALAHQRAMAALRERVKELSCLYDIVKVFGEPGISLEELLGRIAQVIAPAWRYPDVACCRIMLDGQAFVSRGFGPGVSRLVAPIVVRGASRGEVEVSYVEPRPERDEGPFLTEERTLIDTIAQQLSLIVEEKESERERLGFQEKMHHADRLATIGQLAAGVAHELNEPLASVLGFAQLALKDEEVAPAVRRDLEKIRAAALHAREIIKKLLFFGRQLPPQKTAVNLNAIIRGVAGILERRLSGARVKTRLALQADLPTLVADAGQLSQVLVNLLVNSLQAMPHGGVLTVTTRGDDANVTLVVEDTGVGMSPEVKAKAFLPFFTTKDVHEGTGLGLAVVHGIVTAHGGAIQLDSESGRGARFTIELPRQAPTV